MSNEELLRTVEAAASRAWPADDFVEFHGWQLRRSGGNSRRLRSVRTVSFDATCSTRDAIDEASAWYRRQGLAPCFQVCDLSEPADLDAELEAAGFARITPTSVLHCRADDIEGTSDSELSIVSVATDEVLDAICDATWSPEVRTQRRDLFQRIASPHFFAIGHCAGRPIAGGLCVIDGPLAGIFSMRTQPEARRTGFARRIFGHLIAEAKKHNVRRFYLQVEDHNEAALRLYCDAGFTRLFGYHYRE